MVVHDQNQFRVHEPPATIGNHSKAATVIGRIILAVGELSSPEVGQAAGIDAIPGASVIGIWSDFCGVQMVGNNAHAGGERVVMGRVGATFVSMFHHEFIVDEDRVAGLPAIGEVIFQTRAAHPGIFRGDLHEAGFKARIVIAEGPEQLRLRPGSLQDLVHAGLAGFQLVND